MKTVYFLIGASGSGKTATQKQLEKQGGTDLQFFYFDSIGVPPFADMEKEYGSTDEWQRAKTKEWVQRIKESGGNAILDGQMRPAYIEEACKLEGITDYKIILIDCADDVRKQRLVGRGHPELASEAMMHWAKYLREACKEGNWTIIDNSALSVDETVSALLNEVK